MMSDGRHKLSDRSRVAIVGGGPAGSFLALFLLHYAREKGFQPDITIYQGRSFSERGPKGCKGCAGILSISLLRNLRGLDLVIPERVIQGKIERYTVHSPFLSITISNPEKDVQIASVYRGNGPRVSHFDHAISFDDWLLGEAQSRGVTVEHNTVSGIHLGAGAQVEVQGQKLEYDLVVLASGVNGRPTPIHGLDYIPPQTRRMAQDELYLGDTQVETYLGREAHAFLIPHSNLIFGTLVPKGPFVNVSVLSRGDRISVSDFLKHELVRRILPERYDRACGCQPRAAIAPAENYYADGFVAVGDAVASRLYKDGIGSSLLTARAAAGTVVEHGFSSEDFARYYEPFCRGIALDNQWGHRLFAANDRVKNSRTLLWAYQRLVGDEQNNLKGRQPFTRAAWGMLTGSYPYRNIARMTLDPLPLTRLSSAVLWESTKQLFSKRPAGQRRLLIGSRRVLILGSGFGGTYVLRHLVPSLNLNENVQTTMVSDENFFLFSPLLHEVAMGGIETRHIAYPIRRLHWRDRFDFILANVEQIDLEARKVVTSAGNLDFDYLVLALGSTTNTSDLGEMESKVFTLKNLHDSMLIRNHIIGLFEQAASEKEPERQRRLLTFVVCGGGYTGIQLVTELRDFIHRGLLRLYKTIDPASVRIVLVEAEPKIVGELHTKLGAYIMRHLKESGIEVRLKARVTHVGQDWVGINDRDIIPTNTLLWTAGVVSHPRIADLDVPKDSFGRVHVNEYLEVPGVPGVYAVGDCACFKDPKTGEPIAPRAHNAVRQAKVVARNILAEIRGRDKRPYRYSPPPEMVSLGASKAVFRWRGLRIYGLPARLIWIFGYALLITGAYNRTRVAMDWLLSVVFGRDTTFLKGIR